MRSDGFDAGIRLIEKLEEFGVLFPLPDLGGLGHWLPIYAHRPQLSRVVIHINCLLFAFPHGVVVFGSNVRIVCC
jgi:hypothetical protein